MLGNQDDSSTTPVAVQEESNTVEKDMTDEQPDAYQHCNTSIYDSMSMSGDALDSSFTTTENDDWESQIGSSTSTQKETPPVSCKMCRSRMKKIRKLQRKKWKLQRELKSRDEQVETLESEKRILEDRC